MNLLKEKLKNHSGWNDLTEQKKSEIKVLFITWFSGFITGSFLVKLFL